MSSELTTIQEFHRLHKDLYNPIEPGRLKGVIVGPWYVVDGYCAARSIKGADTENVSLRVAFIEKTPRVRVNYLIEEGDKEFEGFYSSDWKNWVQGYKGSGGGDPEEDGTYGFYQPSRDWCDDMLRQLGATLED